MQTSSHSTTTTVRRPPTRLAVLTLALLALPFTASGQLRVDAKIYASSGSCAQCDLSGKRMNGMTLKNANFAGSLFNNSNLSGGKLHGSDLSGAHFRNALMYGVSGEQVLMNGAVLEDATLTDASLSNSVMRQANLHRAELTRGSFHDNDFQAANMIRVKAPGVNFARSNFGQVDLDGANLEGAMLDGGQFVSARFGTANLDGATLADANLSGADLSKVEGLTQAQLDTACGNRNTRLPLGYNIRTCEDRDDDIIHLTAVQTERPATDWIDRAIVDVETLIEEEEDQPTLVHLRRIHSDLIRSRAALRQ